MTPADISLVSKDSSPLPIARIDAQDEEFVMPLREYFATNGCQVILNGSTSQSVAYHIVAGDFNFVKSIFSSDAQNDVHRLAIVLGLLDPNVVNDLSKKCKVVLVDPVHLTPQDVIEIFSFFFTRNGALLDKRRTLHDAAPVKPSINIYSKIIDTSSKQESMNVSSGEEKGFVDHPPIDDQERIGHIMSDVFRDQEKVTRHRRRKGKYSLLSILGFIIVIFLLPFVWYGVSMTATGISFYMTAKSLETGNTGNAKQLANIGQYWLHQSSFALSVTSFPFQLAGFDGLVRSQERLVSLCSDLAQAFTDTIAMTDSGKQVATQLLSSQSGGGAGSPVVAMNQLQLSVNSVIPTLGLAQAELATLIRGGSFPFSVGYVSVMATHAEASITSLRQSLTSVSEMLTLYPLIAGYQEPKNYLILLQNSNELRPTGGFIGSVGLAKFDGGTMSDFSIQDVYALDGQLKGHVDPPAPLADLLGEEHWYLRDSNWDPDFSLAATRSAWFYQKEAGSPVDGVIAVNVPVVTDLLKITGPITLSDYHDQISADNFFGKSFYYTQHDFFPGSTQKRDFLGTLMRSLITKITSDPSMNPVALFRAFTSGFTRKDIQLWFTNPSLEELVDHYQWSGRLFSLPACQGVDPSSCTFDPVAAVEANLSVSKVNYFVKRSAVRELTIAPDGSINESFSLNVKNTADTLPKDQAPGLGGAYVTYIRFYTTADAQVSDVTLDGVPIHSRDPKVKGQPALPYIEPSIGPVNVHIIGIAVAIAPGTDHTIRVSFARANALMFGRGGAVLDLFNYKHPGISDEAVKTVIHYPMYWETHDESTSGMGVPSTSLAKDGQVEYNTTILEDQLIRLRFTK